MIFVICLKSRKDLWVGKEDNEGGKDRCQKWQDGHRPAVKVFPKANGCLWLIVLSCDDSDGQDDDHHGKADADCPDEGG